MTSSLITGVVFYISKKNLTEHSIKNLKIETKLLSIEFQNAFEKLNGDIILLSKTPPIQGIIRSSHNHGIDPLDQSKINDWKKRLETIFISMINVRKHYTQIRFIGAANNGKELVRVNQNNGAIDITPDKKLQHKNREPYFPAGMKQPKGKVYFSKITYNRENGKIVYPLVPTLRVVIPIYENKNTVFGILVINIDYEKYLKDILMRSVNTKDVLLYNQYGDYFQYDSKKNIIKYVQNKPDKFNALNFNTQQNRTENTGNISNQLDTIFVKENIYLDKDASNSILKLLVSVNKKELFRNNNEIINMILFMGSLIILLSFFLTSFFSKRLMKPLHQMSEDIIASKTYDDITTLPTHLNDEVGNLARALKNKTTRLRKLAMYDGLTGLPNRKHFAERFKQAILRAKRNKKLMALFYIDLNDFKPINDSYGHDYGDALLKAISTNFFDIARKTDFVARIGGDEFAVIIEDIKNKKQAMLAAARYQENLNKTYTIKDITITSSISLGVAIYPLDGKTTDVLLKVADTSMYAAKNEKKPNQTK